MKTRRRPQLLRLSLRRAPGGLWSMKFSFGIWVVASGVYDNKRLAVERAESLYLEVRVAVDQLKQEQAHLVDHYFPSI